MMKYHFGLNENHFRFIKLLLFLHAHNLNYFLFINLSLYNTFKLLKLINTTFNLYF